MSGGPLELWTTGDIARVLGLSKAAVYNWAYRGSGYLPPPHAVTQDQAQKLWTTDQVKQITADYWSRVAPSA